jgi:hypothetical protein
LPWQALSLGVKPATPTSAATRQGQAGEVKLTGSPSFLVGDSFMIASP